MEHQSCKAYKKNNIGLILLTPNLENCFFVNNCYGKIRLDNKKNKNTHIFIWKTLNEKNHG